MIVTCRECRRFKYCLESSRNYPCREFIEKTYDRGGNHVRKDTRQYCGNSKDQHEKK